MNVTAQFETQAVSYTQPVHKYAIIKHLWREAGLSYAPDTCKVSDRPIGEEQGNKIPVTQEWWDYIKKLNSPGGYAWARSVYTMWINTPYDQTIIPDTVAEMAKSESINCGGNFIAYDEETATHVRMLSWDWRFNPLVLSPTVDNWMNFPYLFWKAALVNIDYKIINPVSKGVPIDVYIPCLCLTETWINKKLIEKFPETGADYRLRGTDVYDGTQPLMTVARDMKRTFHKSWFYLESTGVIPPPA